MEPKFHKDMMEAQLADIPELAAFMGLVSHFGRAMSDRHEEKRKRGWSGWDDSSFLPVLERRLVEKVSQGLTSPKDLVDIANFAAFLWNFRVGEQPLPDLSGDRGIMRQMEKAEMLMKYGLSFSKHRILNYKLDIIRDELGLEPGCVVLLEKTYMKGEGNEQLVVNVEPGPDDNWKQARFQAMAREGYGWGDVGECYSWRGGDKVLKSRARAEADGDLCGSGKTEEEG